jgi:hypothetical protein
MKRIIENINNNKSYSIVDINYLIYNYSLAKIFSNLRVELSEEALHFILTNYPNTEENYPQDLLFRGIYRRINNKISLIKNQQVENSIDYILNILGIELVDFVNLYIKENLAIYKAAYAIDFFTMFYSILTEDNKNKLYDIILFKDIKKLLENTPKKNDFNLVTCCKERPEIKDFISKERYVYYDCINDDMFIQKYNINEILYLLEGCIDNQEEINNLDAQYIVGEIIGKEGLKDVSEEYNDYLSLLWKSLDLKKITRSFLEKDKFYGNRYANFLNLFKNIFDEKMEKRMLKKVIDRVINEKITRPVLKRITTDYVCKYESNQKYLNGALLMCKLK